jgi:hypothetical protein
MVQRRRGLPFSHLFSIVIVINQQRVEKMPALATEIAIVPSLIKLPVPLFFSCRDLCFVVWCVVSEKQHQKYGNGMMGNMEMSLAAVS